MDKANKANCSSLYAGYNFKRTGEWAIDLEEFEPYIPYINGNASGPGFSIQEWSNDAGGQKLGLQNIPCYSVDASHNTTDQLNSVVILGSTYIDQILTTYAGRPSNF